MARILLLVLSVFLASGCRKRSAPEFYALESTHSILVAREGDDAYADDNEEMNRVAEGLKRISPDAIEATRAHDLLELIAKERRRIAKEASEQAAALASASETQELSPLGGMLEGSGESPVPNEAAASDAGPEKPKRPIPGMSEKDFMAAFSSCFSQGPPKRLPGQPEGKSLQVIDSESCRKQFGSMQPEASTFYLFVDDKWSGTVTETKQVVPPAPAERTVSIVDAGTVLLVPGMPAPEGYSGIPGAPAPSR